MCKHVSGGILVALTLCLMLQALAVCAAPVASGTYGPCCPYVTGKAHPSATAAKDYWGAGTFKGPRFVCQTPRTVAVVYEGKVHRVDGIEVTGKVLVPQRVLALTGATVSYEGGRKIVTTLGTRKVEYTLGQHEVVISDGASTRKVGWALCPRLRNDITYVPLRQAAEALGLQTEWKNRGIILTSTQVPTGLTSAKCPADEMEEQLGITLLRGPLNGRFGPGVGVLAVTLGGRAAKLGLQPRDVILFANGQRVQCPKDLLAAATLPGAETSLESLNIARGGQEMTLKASR